MGDFRGQKRPFWVLLENGSKNFAENLSKVSSTKDLSNHIGHPYWKTVLDPLWGTFHTFQTFHSIPWVKKNRIFFFAFFLRIESFWLQKCKKKILTRFFAFEVMQTWDLEFYLEFFKLFDFLSFFFFRIESFWVQKNEKIFLAHYEVRPTET